MSYTDKTLTCVDCGATFTFSASEQETFAQRGYTNEPKRCSTCRDARKAQRGGSSTGGSGQPPPAPPPAPPPSAPPPSNP